MDKDPHDVARFVSCASLEGVTLWRRCEPKGEKGPREVVVLK